MFATFVTCAVSKAAAKKRLSRHKGFTLLEIMVVIVILGLLASLVIPSLMGNKEKADRQKAITDIATLENALDMYKLDNGRYPTDQQGMPALVTKPEIAPVPNNYRADGYIRRLPNDPWGNEYLLRNLKDSGRVEVCSMGQDGEYGTEKDICNFSDNF
jgi:general secretion pathway protein G